MIRLDRIRASLDGVVPSFLATADADGTPNISEISQVQYVDADHVALSYQFFNKTRRNVLATRRASVVVVDPATAALHRLRLEFLETRAEGPVFEAMRAKLAGIAAHTGMDGVFKLLGADLYRVLAIEALPGPQAPAEPRPNLLASARAAAESLSDVTEAGELLDRLLAALDRHLGVAHAMVLMADRATGALSAVASRGYPDPCLGWQVAPGQGLIGVAAEVGVPIRVGQLHSDQSYVHAVREGFPAEGHDLPDGPARPFPGLARPLSQLAVPLRWGGRTRGVLFAESDRPQAFGYDEEDAVALVLGQAAALFRLLEVEEPEPRAAAPANAPLRVRRFAADDTIFLGPDYLIKGVAGAILWALLTQHARDGRTEFTNRELRLDPALRLPDHAENLETRLLLLQRRLEERRAAIRLEKTGRGRFRLALAAPVELEEADAGARARAS